MSENIVVTGFGKFKEHTMNPSWEAIKDGQLKIDRPNIIVITKEIDVSYKAVQEQVKEFWKTHKPILMVHVGLAACSSCVKLEKRARHGPYLGDDIYGTALHAHLKGKSCQFDESITCLNIESICDKLNQLHKQGSISIPFNASNEAGLFLCEFIYQESLKICDRTVFIHVPNVSEKITLDDIRLSIKYAIEACLDGLNEV